MLNFLSRLLGEDDPEATGMGQIQIPDWMGGRRGAQSNAMQEVAPLDSGGVNIPELQIPDIPQERRPRHSFLERIGQLSDVLAEAGDERPGYQSTLDARQNREYAAQDHDFRTAQQRQQLASGEAASANDMRARLGSALKGIAGHPDAANIWPQIAEQAGIDPQRAAAIGQLIQNNPNAAGILAQSLGAADAQEYGLQPFYATGPDGQLRAYQLGKDGNPHPVTLGEGETPIDPLKFVDTGGNMVGVGTRSGNPARILPKQEAPGRAADRQSRERIAARGNDSRERVAATRGPVGKAGTASPTEIAEAAKPLVAELRSAVTRLYQSGGMSSSKQSTLGTLDTVARESLPGYERFRSPEGFSARQDLERVLTTGITTLIPLMTGQRVGSKNYDAAAEQKLLRTAVASAKDYPSAIRAINAYEAKIKQLTPATAAPKSPPSSGWGKATVVR